ncbi:MAG: hypothetical protein KY459_11870 [Acidobacteria bacterium]|nr:hypothetical protein [Acidobacteriota bacterium]
MNLRCTAKLAKRLKLGKLEKVPSSGELFAEWHANVIWVDRKPLILAVEDRTRLPLLVRARDLDRLPQHLAGALSEILAEIGIEPEVADGYASQLASGVRYSASVDKSVLGTINDCANTVSYHYAAGSSLFECMKLLSTMPMGPLGYNSPGPVVRAVIRFDPTVN